MNYPAGSISEIELTGMYGKEILPFAKPYLREGYIPSPFSYQALMETALWSMVQQYERETYKKWHSVYSEDATSRFLDMKEELKRFVFKEGLHTTLTVPYLGTGKIPDLYRKYFKETDIGPMFKSEKDLENVLFDSLHYFDLGETLIVEQQKATRSGPVDLFIKHKNDVYLVELKKGIAKRKDVYQVIDYIKGFNSSESNEVHAILIAHQFDENVLKLAGEMGVCCYKYCIGMDIPDTLIVLEELVPNKSFNDLYEFVVNETGHIVSTLPEFSVSHNEKVLENLKKVIKTVDWISYCLDKYSKGA